MTLKRKVAFSLSIAFSILFGVVMFVIYFLFNGFRKDEFRDRFIKRLDFTIHFIESSKNFKEEASLFFDENSDNVLLNEQILIFNKEKELLYSTTDIRGHEWTAPFLEKLDVRKVIYEESSMPEVYAVLRSIKGESYYIITTAVDVNGNSKLQFLKYLLLFSYALSCLWLWMFCYRIVGRFLRPLEYLNARVSDITAHQLTTQLPEVKSNDEIGILTKSFNTMMKRLDDVFQSQKDFTASASHEIRTPLTRMSFQLENLLRTDSLDPIIVQSLGQMQSDVRQLSDLTNSLLLLNRFDKENIQSIFEHLRIDELIFESFQKVEHNFPFLKLDFEISSDIEDIEILELCGVKALLEIVFINLFKNIAVYSEDSVARVYIHCVSKRLVVDVLSKGKALGIEEQNRLFEAFMRGSNSHNTSGSGLGLRISKRILDYHNADIAYIAETDNDNLFRLTF